MKAAPLFADGTLLLRHLFAENDLVDKVLAVVVDDIISALADAGSRRRDGLFGTAALHLLFQARNCRFNKIAAGKDVDIGREHLDALLILQVFGCRRESEGDHLTVADKYPVMIDGTELHADDIAEAALLIFPFHLSFASI